VRGQGCYAQLASATATGSRSASARPSRHYKAYYEAVLPLLAENGLVIADNVLWSGRVVEDDGDESTLAIKDFNEHVRNDPRVASVMLTVRDGMTLIRKRD
jgi:caffeoyl-CoA O-methyltransferase